MPHCPSYQVYSLNTSQLKSSLSFFLIESKETWSMSISISWITDHYICTGGELLDAMLFFHKNLLFYVIFVCTRLFPEPCTFLYMSGLIPYTMFSFVSIILFEFVAVNWLSHRKYFTWAALAVFFCLLFFLF